MLTGAFVGSETEYYSRADAMERWQGRPLDVQNVFVTWDERTDPIDRIFDRQLPAIRDAGRVPMLTWEPFTEGPEDTPTDVDRRIADGEYDDYLRWFRSRLRSWLAGPDGEFGTGDDRALYLRFAHEANGDWYPWAPTNDTSAATYRRMWRKVHRTLMADEFSSYHVRWVWTVNHADVGDVRAERLYPGETFVDWIGVDGFNWGASQEWSSWDSPWVIFDDMLDRVGSLGEHPIAIPEYASTSLTEDGHSTQEKNRWIRAAFEYFAERRIDMALWFNIDKETDWPVFDGDRGDMSVTIDETVYTGYSAYRTAIRSLEE